MKLNNRGITLIELLISVALISVVLLFLYSLLDDVSNDVNSPDFAIENQTTRFEIINYIYELVDDSKIEKVEESEKGIYIYTNDEFGSNRIDLEISSVENNNVYNKFTVKLKGVPQKSWIMHENCYLDKDSFRVDDKIMFSLAKRGYKIVFEIYTANDDNNLNNNNSIDDIILYFTD